MPRRVPDGVRFARSKSRSLRLGGRSQNCRRRLTFEPLEERALLAVITVTSLADDLAVDGQVTLREAIRAAELDVSVDGSVAGSGADTIEFAAALAGDVLVSGPQFDSAFDVTTAITIRGNAAGITIRRDATTVESRLFRVLPGGALHLESLTLAGGIAQGVSPTAVGGDGRGGAIYNLGTLEIVSCTLTSNMARGSNGQGSSPGGAGWGGAIFSEGGSVTIINSTLSGNRTQSGSGGTIPSSLGGAVHCRNGSLAIFNSTITANSATAARGVFIVGDGETATFEIHSTIIGQADTSFATTEVVATFEHNGTIVVTGGNNLVRGNKNNFAHVVASQANPQLAELADNGGPTWTHALMAGSPALDQGSNPRGLATDQRGGAYARVSGLAPDIGAFEVQTTGGPTLVGDYNGNQVVDAADYVVWRHMHNANVAPFSGADGNGDGHVDDDDYDVWRANFGRMPAAATVDLPQSASTIDLDRSPRSDVGSATETLHSTAAADLTFAGFWGRENPLRPWERSAPSPDRLPFSSTLRLDALEWALIDWLDAGEADQRESALPRVHQLSPGHADGDESPCDQQAPHAPLELGADLVDKS